MNQSHRGRVPYKRNDTTVNHIIAATATTTATATAATAATATTTATATAAGAASAAANGNASIVSTNASCVVYLYQGARR